MANLLEDIQCAGLDTRPPMLDRTDFASWQQRIRLYYRGKENEVNILKSIDEGPYRMGTMESSATREYPSLIHTFFLTHNVGGVFLNLEEKALYDEMLRLHGLGSNPPSGVPYTDDEIMAILESQPEYGGGSGSGGCGDDESEDDEPGDDDLGDDEDGDEDGKDEDDS
nr:integrase, catalytic region, zinc finger, CCHC-type, peptidase aspartic, catalytic [Tanacetum cinerariifolium]